MGLGVLEPSSAGPVPGTVRLGERESESENDWANLKRGTGRRRDVILRPQPSDDPNDPLNWPYYQKVIILMIIVYGGCICVCCTSPLLNSSFYLLSVELNRSFTDLALVSGYQILVAGAMGPFVSALSAKYGKRAILLFSSVACLVGTIIGSCAKTYDMLLTARVVQGVCLAAWESLPFTIVGDLFFVHERGFWTAVISFILTAVSNLTSVIAGQIVVATNWHYLFHIMNGSLVLLILLQYFFVPETCYRRASAPESSSPPSPARDEKDIERISVSQVEESLRQDQILKKSFVQSLALFTGTYNDQSLFRLVFAPFAICTNVVALWTVLITGALTSFYVALAYVTAQLFGPPPYGLSAAGVGNLSVGPFIGGAVGSLLVGLMMDPLCLWLVKKNGGIYEPEFRLPLNVLGLCCGAGLVGFGAITQAQGNIYLVVFMWGFTLFGIAFVCGACSAYAIDAFHELSNEIFILNIMFKNFLFYGYSYFINGWVADAGAGIPFYTLAGISFGLVGSVLIVYLYGKRYRYFWSQHNLVKAFSVVATSQS